MGTFHSFQDLGHDRGNLQYGQEKRQRSASTQVVVLYIVTRVCIMCREIITHLKSVLTAVLRRKEKSIAKGKPNLSKNPFTDWKVD